MREQLRNAGLLGACACLALALAACRIASVPSITQWTVTGTAQWTGTSPRPVFLSAFYYKLGVGTPSSTAPVSNIVNLGGTAATPMSFTLNINASALAPAAGDSILIQMWDDANGNNLMDDGVGTSSYCRSDTGDADFTSTYSCQFVFSGVAWYLGAVTIQSAPMTSAVITNVTPVN